jgi:hypothetical protein
VIVTVADSWLVLAIDTANGNVPWASQGFDIVTA